MNKVFTLIILMSLTLYSGESNILYKSPKLRIVSYNAYFTSIFPSDDGNTDFPLHDKKVKSADRIENFAQWVNKAQADIWVFQEVIYGKKQGHSVPALQPISRRSLARNGLFLQIKRAE